MDDRRKLKRPPALGELKRTAEAQALTLRAELRVALTLDSLTVEQIAREAKVKPAELETFLAGSAMNPRWQAKLEAWLARRD
jgi:hypothetical protein